MLKLKNIVIVVLLLLPFADKSYANEPLILVNADSLIGSLSDRQETRLFQGNVEFRHGNVHTLCDTAIWNITSNTIDLMGNVVVTQTSLTLTGPKMFYNANTSVAEAKKGVIINDQGTFISADRGFYYTKNREVNFFGNVIVDEDSVIIAANHINHFRNNKNTYAFGEVSIRGKYNNTVLFGDTVINLPQLNYSMATAEPVLMQTDTNFIIRETNEIFNQPYFTIDTLLISCDTIKSFRDSDNEVFRFIDSVNILRNDLASKAGYAVYYKHNEKILLNDNPVLWYENTQLFGDTLRINLINNKLSKITSLYNSFVVANTDTSYTDRLNQISGDFLEIKFDENEIFSIIADGDVKSLYFLFSDGYPDGADLAAADRIEIFFDEGEAVQLLKLSGVSGEIINEDLLYKDVMEYYLPGYRNRNDKPKKNIFNFFD